jgi:hypothetical protein
MRCGQVRDFLLVSAVVWGWLLEESCAVDLLTYVICLQQLLQGTVSSPRVHVRRVCSSLHGELATLVWRRQVVGCKFVHGVDHPSLHACFGCVCFGGRATAYVLQVSGAGCSAGRSICTVVLWLDLGLYRFGLALHVCSGGGWWAGCFVCLCPQCNQQLLRLHAQVQLSVAARQHRYQVALQVYILVSGPAFAATLLQLCSMSAAAVLL